MAFRCAQNEWSNRYDVPAFRYLSATYKSHVCQEHSPLVCYYFGLLWPYNVFVLVLVLGSSHHMNVRRQVKIVHHITLSPKYAAQSCYFHFS
jgi:hypothetical protein